MYIGTTQELLCTQSIYIYLHNVFAMFNCGVLYDFKKFYLNSINQFEDQCL